MNCPKRTISRRQPALWTSPLASMADAEARRYEDRMNAQARPFIITMSLQAIAIILFVGIVLWGEQAIATRTVNAPDHDTLTKATILLVRTLAWALAGIAFVELLFWSRHKRRWTKSPYTNLQTARATSLLGLLAMGMVFVGMMASLAIFDPKFVFVGGYMTLMLTSLYLIISGRYMTLMLTSLYLIISGIRRRVGWEPSCAKCGYPHPDDTLTTCPECGRPTPPRSHTAVILGSNTNSYPRIAKGLALLAAAAALIATR